MGIPGCKARPGLAAEIKAYLQALGREMSLRAADASPVDTLYLGGGTPTLLGGERLAGLLDAIGKTFQVVPDAEVTVEANPGTVDLDLLRQLRAAGCNRLSVGVQSFDDEVLRSLGRIHTAEEGTRAVADARRVGLDNISLDLIYAVPGQTLESWRRTLQVTCGLNVDHVSAYALTIEPGTPLAEKAAAGEVEPAADEQCLEMMELARLVLGQAGLRRYEISNLARPGRECRHNLRTWRGEEYLGVGAGAHSFLRGIRWANVASPGSYAALLASGHLPVAWAERLSSDRRAEEALVLALRTAEGAPLSDAQARRGRDWGTGHRNAIRELVESGLLEVAGGRVRLTREGVAVANDVFLRLMA